MALRPIDMTIINNTDVGLKFSNPKAIHGETPSISSGSATLQPNGGQCTVHAENSGLGFDFWKNRAYL